MQNSGEKQNQFRLSQQGSLPGLASPSAAQLPSSSGDRKGRPYTQVDDVLIQRSIYALRSGPQEKMAHTRYLMAQEIQAGDEQFRKLLDAIQLALLGGDLAQAGKYLTGEHRQAWQKIVAGVQQQSQQSQSQANLLASRPSQFSLIHFTPSSAISQ